MKSKQVVVLGLGVFGSTITKTLSQYGCEVVAVDKCPECVQRVSEFDVGIVAIGNHLEESLLGVLNLKEIGIPYIIAKAKNKRFKSILEKIGADRIIRPEKEMGERLARTLLRKNITDLVELDENYSLVEMKVPQAWVGHTLSSLDLRKKYGINILGQRDMETQKIELYVNPEHVLRVNDHFLMVAETEKIERFDYLIV